MADIQSSFFGDVMPYRDQLYCVTSQTVISIQFVLAVMVNVRLCKYIAAKGLFH